MRFLTDYPTPRPGWPFAAALTATMFVLAIAVPQSAFASEETRSVAVRHVDRHPATEAAARRTLARLGQGALEVCGASPFSVPQMRIAIRASRCWKDSMARAVRQIDNSTLADLYERTSNAGGKAG